MLVVMILIGVLTIASAFGVVFSKRSLHSALSLIATMFFVAIHFALLRADFLAALQIMVYAGAIMVLVVFVIMLLGIDESVDTKAFGLPGILSASLALSFAGLLLYAINIHSIPGLSDSLVPPVDTSGVETVAGFGKLLITKYFFAFQAIGVLLLAAIVGAVLLAHDKRRPLASGRGLKAMQSANQVSETSSAE